MGNCNGMDYVVDPIFGILELERVVNVESKCQNGLEDNHIVLRRPSGIKYEYEIDIIHH